MKDVLINLIVITSSSLRGAKLTDLHDLLHASRGYGLTFALVEDAGSTANSALRSVKREPRCILIAQDGPCWTIEQDVGARVLMPVCHDSPEDALILLHQSGSFARETTLVIGASESDLALAKHCVIYLHVGEESVLRTKVRRVVPLWGQYFSGVSHAISYLGSKGFRDNTIDHRDMVAFIDRTIAFYESDLAASKVMARHAAFCAELELQFPDEICGIFGAGFPFYCAGPLTPGSHVTTPPSILRYLREQRSYFDSKLIEPDQFEVHRDASYTVGSAREELGLRLDRNRFDVYEYECRGQGPPQAPDDPAELERFYDATCFDIGQDMWPCDYCVTLQAPDIFPDQRTAKDTNVTCLRCRQTSFMLRNIATCCVDLDAIVVVRGDDMSAAHRIKDFVINESSCHLYDLDLRRTVFNDNDGPVDLFVTTASEMISTLADMASPDWVRASFRSVALWSLTLPEHLFNLGENFAVSFEPQTELDPDLHAALVAARHTFACSKPAEEVIRTLGNHSLAFAQLLSNAEVKSAITSRLESWRRAFKHRI